MDSTIINITLTGIRDIMFDRYAGDNNTELTPEQKLYYDQDGETLVIPALNIHSFLSAENTKSAVKLMYDSRVYKKKAAALLGFVMIDPVNIPITRKGKPIKFKGFDKNGITLCKTTPRLSGGVPNPKTRPIVNMPWEMSFQLQLFPNDEVSELEVQNLFDKGGIMIGLGTYRGVFGKFVVSKWERVKSKKRK